MKQEFYQLKREELFQQLENNSVAILFSGVAKQKTHDQDYLFSVNRNFHYLTGLTEENNILVLYKVNNQNVAKLFLPKNDATLVKWVGKKLEKEEAQSISGIDLDQIYYIEEFENFLFQALNPNRHQVMVQHVYLDLERRNMEGFQTLGIHLASRLRQEYPGQDIRNVFPMIVRMRMVKTEEEVLEIKDSIQTTKGGILEMMQRLQPGMYENQIVSFFDQYIKFHGNATHAFDTIAAGGGRATVLHYVENNAKLVDGDLVLFDLGAMNKLYVSDISRTFPVNGKFTKRQKEVYQVVLDTNKACIAFAKVGTTWKELNDFAKAKLVEGAKRIGLIQEDQEISKYYYHSIGHSMGLDTHDPSLYDVAFEEGMVITIEPGLYIAEEGIGVRVEDDILITQNGAKNLSEDIIKEIDEIEEFMNQ